jgi:hypothetical protein
MNLLKIRHLTPNGAATQRRDIVGTNASNSKVWQRIERDYGIRQMVFDAKNYQDVGRDEYRQMSTYLTGSYGRLGFLVTRDSNPDIRGAELDWVKEMYNSTDRKLIIRLYYKFFIKMLSKLRSPEKFDVVDDALAKIIDTYERRYLGQSSTNRLRKIN